MLNKHQNRQIYAIFVGLMKYTYGKRAVKRCDFFAFDPSLTLVVPAE